MKLGIIKSLDSTANAAVSCGFLAVFIDWSEGSYSSPGLLPL